MSTSSVDLVPAGRDPHAGFLAAPILSIEQIKKRYELIKELYRDLMLPDVHYGSVSKNGKPTLLKAGAELLCTFFGLEPALELVDKIEQWDQPEPFFYYRYRVTLRHNGRVTGIGEGACNSREIKYRYRGGGRICPLCQEAAILRSQYGGWYCAEKKGGCNAKFNADDPQVAAQDVSRTLNPDIADSVNTYIKMGQKRSYVAATLMATMASEFFTQDLEDFTAGEEPDAPPRRSAPAPDSAPPPAANYSNSGPPRISEAQRKRFYALCKTAGKSDNEIDAYCVSQGFNRANEITVDRYNAMCAWAQGAPPPSAPPPGPTPAGPRRQAPQQPMFDRGGRE